MNLNKTKIQYSQNLPTTYVVRAYWAVCTQSYYIRHM